MAIADDISVAANGDIRYTGTTANYTVLQLHRFLQDLADDAAASGNDFVDISSLTPSERSTDNIITLLGAYNIDDTLATHLYGGSITQLSGATVYSGLRVLGSVSNINTELQIIQDGALYDGATPFWGNQSTGGYNGNAAQNLLMRVMVKSRDNGADIDGKQIRVQARHWGDSYDFFNVTLGQGEAVAAIGTTPDAQNTTSQGTVTAYTHVTNTEGFQTINLNNGNGAREYYSKWTYGADTSGDGLKGVWEFGKDLVGNGTAKTIHGVNGELFLGVTHSWAYDNELSGPYAEDETVVWGTAFSYDTEAGGPFTVGEYLSFGTSGAVGKLLQLTDAGTTGSMIVAIEAGSGTVVNTEAVTGLASGATCAVSSVPTDTGAAGGTGLLLALDDDGTTGNLYIQLTYGSVPVDNLKVTGRTSGATSLVAGSAASKTVPKMFLGSYTGSMIGAYGVGIDAGDLTASDTIQDLSATTQTPPNNVTFTVSSIVSGEDRVLVGPRSAGILQVDQFGVKAGGVTAGASTIAIDATIPADTPASGTIRVQSDAGVYERIPYTSYTGDTFTLTGTAPSNAAAANDVFISYIDKLADATSATFTTIYSAPRDLFVRVRDGAGTPIKTFETPASLSSTGGSVAAIRTPDV